jgi:uncharacterized protein YndB with AHSA1/START domain
MSTQAQDTAVNASIVVAAPVERAFAAFTEEIGSWWAADKHILDEEIVEMVFEPRVGGQIYDRGRSGAVSRWARVLAYDPPERVVFSWDIGLDWQVESDPEKTSEVEVRFLPEAPGRTRVEVEHRHLERHGEGWEGMRDAVGSPNGWRGGLEPFAEYLAG